MNREEAKRFGWFISCRSEIYEHINKIYDDFESRTCENCIYYNDMNESSGLCENMALPELGVDKDFGCNKFSRKEQ